MRSVRVALVFCLAAIAAVACGPGAATQSPRSLQTAAPTPRPPDLPVTTPPPVTNVPPSILETVMAEAARLSDIPVDQVTVERAEPAVWPNGALGCPQPGEMYTQALVDGYWIILRAGTESYDFRVASTGSFRLCSLPCVSLPPGLNSPN